MINIIILITIIISVVILYFFFIRNNAKMIRYVRIQRTDDKHASISISGLEAFVNSAKINPIGGSIVPQFDDPSVFGPQHLYDGKKETIAHSADSKDGYVEIDLGKEMSITSVKILNRFDCCQERLIGCSLKLLNKKITTTQQIYNITIQ